jgi:imidazolonepropionase-like amidohydrolase
MATPDDGTLGDGQPERLVIRGVRVFTGESLSEPSDVAIAGDRIESIAPANLERPGAQPSVEGHGAVLLAGLIDAHVHLHGYETLELLASHGVTTALDMATWPPPRLAALRNQRGVTDIRSAGTPAIGPGGPHARIPGMLADALVAEPGAAPAWVAQRLAEGSDYIKLVVEAPGEGGPDQATLEALVVAAHGHGKKVVAHAATPGAYALAVAVGADVLTHIPIGRPLDPETVAALTDRVAVPTLTMMEGVASVRGAAAAFPGAMRSVGLLHEAGVTVLAGTDANTQPGVPFQVPHGSSLHRELELLVNSGLDNAAALRSATSATADYFGLHDRGRVQAGLRADLVLIDGDPLGDITATRRLRHVWCAGVEVAPSAIDG